MSYSLAEKTSLPPPERPLPPQSTKSKDAEKGKDTTMEPQEAPREQDTAAVAVRTENRKKIRYFLLGFGLAAVVGTIIGVTVSQVNKDDTSGTPTPTQLVVQTSYSISVIDDQVLLDSGSYVSDLEASMDILAAQVVVETFPQSARLRRKLLVTLSSEGTKIIGNMPAGCPDSVPSGVAVCKEIISSSLLELVDEDSQAVEASYVDNMNTAIEQGRLQEVLDEVAPDSPVDILDNVPDETPPPTTVAPITPFPTTLPPTTPAPTTYEEFLSSLLAEKSPWSVDAWEVPGSPQSQAFDWLLADAVTRGMEDAEPDEDRILQRYALATLFYTMGDDGFMDETWLEATDECTWRGVEACSSEGLLQNLDINQDNMPALPLELGLLTNLVEFEAFADVYDVDVPSRITLLPSTIGLLTNMRRFDVAYYVDGLAEEEGYTCGPIPTSVGQMTALEVLKFGGAFTGIIPSQIEYLVDLTELRFVQSQLTGSIPSQIGELTKLTYLHLDENKFVDSIPKQLASLSNLLDLDLSENPLGGPFHSELGRLTKLTNLNIGRCELTGPMPSEIGDLTLLQNFRLSGNALTSTIPTQVGRMTALEDLDLSSNSLDGEIPSDIGILGERLRILRLEGNRLSSTLPTELGFLSNLFLLRAGGNELRGNIPVQIGSLSRLDILHLGHNQLTGTLPSELQHLTGLRFLTLNDNKIDGSVPAFLSEITNLNRLYLHNLDLVGTVPDSICSLTHLTPFYFTVDCSAVTCRCCHVCETRGLIDIARYEWEDGAVDTKESFHPINHNGKLEDGVTAKDGKLTVFDDRGVHLGPLSELDGATEVLFRFEDVNITDTRDWLYHVLLGGGYSKYWVGIYYDDYWGGNVRTLLRFNIGGFEDPSVDFAYDLGPGAVKYFNSIEYFFEASQPSNQRLAIRYNDGEWARGGWNDSDWTTSFPISDKSVKINDGARADWDPMNATLGPVTISANRP